MNFLVRQVMYQTACLPSALRVLCESHYQPHHLGLLWFNLFCGFHSITFLPVKLFRDSTFMSHTLLDFLLSVFYCLLVCNEAEGRLLLEGYMFSV